jgi:hypothetical protein
MKISIISLLILVSLYSCSIEKRIYRPGFNIGNNHAKIKTGNTSEKHDDVSFVENYSEENTIERPTSEMIIVDEILDSPNQEIISSNLDGIENSESETNNVIAKEYQNEANLINLDPLSCDIIVCKNGDEIEAKVLEIGIKEIKYKRCDNEQGPTISILNSNVVMIKYPNGTKDIIKSATSSSDDTEPKTNVYALLSIICGVLSVITLFGSILFATLAIIFSKLANKEIAMEKEKYKENSMQLARSGKIIAIIGLIFSALLSFILFFPF